MKPSLSTSYKRKAPEKRRGKGEKRDLLLLPKFLEDSQNPTVRFVRILCPRGISLAETVSFVSRMILPRACRFCLLRPRRSRRSFYSSFMFRLWSITGFSRRTIERIYRLTLRSSFINRLEFYVSRGTITICKFFLEMKFSESVGINLLFDNQKSK